MFVTVQYHEFPVSNTTQKLLPGHLFTKQTDVLPQDLVKPRSCKILAETLPIALKFDKSLGSSTAEMPVKFQSDTIIETPNLSPSTLLGIWR